jgi:hypothetical protein
MFASCVFSTFAYAGQGLLEAQADMAKTAEAKINTRNVFI